MYKKFALFVLLLAPILVMMADAWTPRDDITEAPQMAEAPPAEQPSAIEHQVATEALTITPLQQSAQSASDAPMLNPVGVDPTPVATDSLAVTEGPAPSADQASADGAQQDSPDDDHP